MLLGRPGAGKTTTLLKLAGDRAEQALEQPAAPLPLLVSLGDWTGEENLDGFLLQSLPELGGTLAALATKGRLILVLDGLNEVPTGFRGERAAAICS